MAYLITNCAAWAFLLILLGVLFYYDRQSWRQTSTQTITICALLIAVACVLTNVISYKIPLFQGIRLDFGLFLIFLIGVCFGPLWGVFSGIIADSLGALIGLGGVYCALFTVNRALFGLAGSAVFLSGKQYRRWPWMTVALYSLMFCCMSFGFNQIYLWLLFGSVAQTLWLIKLIKLPFELIFWNMIILISAKLMLHLTTKHFHGYLWWNRRDYKLKPLLVRRSWHEWGYYLPWKKKRVTKESSDDFNS